MPRATGFVTTPAIEAEVTGQVGSDGHYVAAPASVAALPLIGTTSMVAGSLIAGDYRDLLIEIRVAFELRSLGEKYADEGKVGVRARLRADVAVARPASFFVRGGLT